MDCCIRTNGIHVAIFGNNSLLACTHHGFWWYTGACGKEEMSIVDKTIEALKKVARDLL